MSRRYRHAPVHAERETMNTTQEFITAGMLIGLLTSAVGSLGWIAYVQAMEQRSLQNEVSMTRDRLVSVNASLSTAQSQLEFVDSKITYLTRKIDDHDALFDTEFFVHSNEDGFVAVRRNQNSGIRPQKPK